MANTAGKAAKPATTHPQASPLVRKVKPNEAQAKAGRAAADICVAAIRRMHAALKKAGEKPDKRILLDRELLAVMLNIKAVHTGAVEAFSVAMLAQKWTVAPMDGTLHTAQNWKLVPASGGVRLTAAYLPAPPAPAVSAASNQPRVKAKARLTPARKARR